MRVAIGGIFILCPECVLRGFEILHGCVIEHH